MRTPILTQPYSGCVHEQTPPVCKHAPRVHTYAHIVGVYISRGTPEVMPALEGCPQAPVALGGVEGEARMEEEAGMERKARTEGEAGVEGEAGMEESKDGEGGSSVASAGRSGRLTRTNPLIDSLPAQP